jgi:hypothetical protein
VHVGVFFFRVGVFFRMSASFLGSRALKDQTLLRALGVGACMSASFFAMSASFFGVSASFFSLIFFTYSAACMHDPVQRVW